MKFQYPEFVDNPENRCPVVLVLDTSESMAGEAIDHLNSGLADFKYQIEKDPLASLRVEVAVVTFGGEADGAPRVLTPFVAVDEMPTPQLAASGLSPMGGAVLRALDLIEERQAIYRAQGIYSYRPWVFLVTDGAPTDEAAWAMAVKRVAALNAQHRLLFWAVGVPGADLDCLAAITAPAHPPIVLQNMDFRTLFQWLSVSVRDVSRGRADTEIHFQAPPRLLSAS